MMTEEQKMAGKASPYLLAALVAILVVAGFLRAYHFGDWLHFELDQARDMRVVDDAFSGGPGELTLLGMKAGGTSLRLGPGFYYLEYLSGLVFGTTPVGVAMIVAVLSVASVFLFFAFARRYFRARIAIGLTALFAVSAYLVMYGRFAWNPNAIPFFALLGFYALLRSVEPESSHRSRWFVLAAFAIGFSTHLHFLAFLALPAITVAFLLIRRPRFSWKTWMAALCMAAALYVPVVLNEIATGGANSKAFVAAVTEKSTKESHSVAAKLVKDMTEHGLGFLVVTTGYEGGDFFEFDRDGSGIRVVCDAGCRHGWPFATVSIVVFSLGAVSLLALGWGERNRRKADLLLLTGLWLLIPFVLYLPLAYAFAPRFFLVMAPVPFLLLGFLAEEAGRVLPWKKTTAWVFVIGITALCASNLWYLSRRFDQLSRAPHEAVKSPTDRILKELVRVPLVQQQAIVAHLKARADATGFPVYMYSEPQHRRALKYLLDHAEVRNDVLGLGLIYEEGVYVLVLRSKSDLYDGMKKYLERYDVADMKPFGTLTVIEFRPKPESVQAKRQTFDESAKRNDSQVSKTNERYTWSGWWNRQSDAWDAGDDDSGEDGR